MNEPMKTLDEWQAEVRERKRRLWAKILASEPPGRAIGKRPRDPEKERILARMDAERLRRRELEVEKVTVAPKPPTDNNDPSRGPFPPDG